MRVITGLHQKKLYEAFMNKGFIDPCPLHCTEDALLKEYYGECLFINPPYSKIKYFAEWAKKQYINGCHVYLLIPSRTDTKYFHELMRNDYDNDYSPNIFFLKGRLKFSESKSAPFPSCIIELTHDWEMTSRLIFCSVDEFIENYLRKVL